MKLKRASLAALCCNIVVCASHAFGQAIAGGDGDCFCSGDSFEEQPWIKPAPTKAVDSAESARLLVWTEAPRITPSQLVDRTDETGVKQVGVSPGDAFSGYGLPDLNEIESYFDNLAPKKDPFESRMTLLEPITRLRLQLKAKQTLVIGRSFPSESAWDAYFAGRRKIPPFPLRPIVQSVPSMGVDPAPDAFNTEAYSIPLSNTFESFATESRDEIVTNRRGRKFRNWRSSVPSRGFSVPAGKSNQWGGSDTSRSGQSAAIARALTEPRWSLSQLPLRVYISGVVSEARNGLVGSEIIAALRDWRNASNGTVRFMITDRYVDADVLFVCENTVEHQWAENIVSYHNGMFDRVKVRLLEETLYKLDPKRLRAICLHEVGHVFGIRNHSVDKRDAMSVSATDDLHPILALTSNDRKAIGRLYP